MLLEIIKKKHHFWWFFHYSRQKFIKNTCSDTPFYCKFCHRIRIWNQLDSGNAQRCLKMGILARKRHKTSWKDGFFNFLTIIPRDFCIFDSRFLSSVKSYMRKVYQIISVALYQQFSYHIWCPGSRWDLYLQPRTPNVIWKLLR